MESLIERSERLDPELRVWVTLDAANAVAAAQELDNATGCLASLPLAGVPIGLKDVIYTKGLRTTASSRALASFVPDFDATVTKRVRAVGAVVLGKLETSEFAAVDPSVSRNPWNLEHTPGGSSSGSAAAVASGIVPVSIGSQTGGSTLRPAAYCGVVGMKPTYGLVSVHGLIPLAPSFDHMGIFGRSVQDVELVLGAVAGHDPQDPASDASQSDGFEASSTLTAPPVFGVLRSAFIDTATPQTLRDIQDVTAKLEAAGAQVRDVRLEEVTAALSDVFLHMFFAEAAAEHEERFARLGNLYGPGITGVIEHGLAQPATAYVRAQRSRVSLMRRLDEAHQQAEVDVFLSPSTPAPAPRDLSTTGDASYLVPWSTAGLPAISLPTKISPEGLPMAIQLVGGRWRDAQLLSIAKWTEAVLGFDAHPPGW